MKIHEANLMTNASVGREKSTARDLCDLGVSNNIYLHKSFQPEATAWVIASYFRQRSVYVRQLQGLCRIIEIGSASSLFALRLADEGFPVAVINDKFHGEFLKAAKEPARDIAVFPRPIGAPWTRFFQGVAGVVLCFNIEEVLPGTLEGRFAEDVDYLSQLLHDGGLLLITANVKLSQEGVGVELALLEQELVKMGWPYGLNARDLFSDKSLGNGTGLLCFVAGK